MLVLCVSVYSIGYVSHYYGKRNVGLFNFLYSTFILSMFFVMTAGNAVFFFVAWEAMAMLSYYLVVFESEQPDKQKAGMLYIIMTHIGTAFLMIAFMLMYSYTKSFGLFGDTSAIPAATRNVMFILFLTGFGVKAGVIPVHIWLPYAHPAAPGNISALMSGIMIKTAVYGILRFVLTYLGAEKTWWGVTILVIGMVSVVLGVAYAFVEKNIKNCWHTAALKIWESSLWVWVLRLLPFLAETRQLAHWRWQHRCFTPSTICFLRADYSLVQVRFTFPRIP
jgi:formate hydrogenlyase subunit 3/multisubunit Na+/H+ antiporter MnhD subunit